MHIKNLHTDLKKKKKVLLLPHILAHRLRLSHYPEITTSRGAVFHFVHSQQIPHSLDMGGGNYNIVYDILTLVKNIKQL